VGFTGNDAINLRLEIWGIMGHLFYNSPTFLMQLRVAAKSQWLKASDIFSDTLEAVFLVTKAQ
jgi:hypothetical protein